MLPRETQRLGFKPAGAPPAGRGKARSLTGADEMAYNDPGKEPAVRFTERAVSLPKEYLEVAPVSATIFETPVK